jgi:hypothetical protein
MLTNLLINEAQIVEQYGPSFAKKGITDESKIKWLSKYTHYHVLSEQYDSGLLNENATLQNVPGMGAILSPSNPTAYGAGSSLAGLAGTINNVFHRGDFGSGDKFPSLLPLAIQVALASIALELVPVIPMAGPTGMLPYLNFTYADGKLNEPGSGNKPLMVQLDVVPNTGQTFVPGNVYYVRETTPGSQNVIGLTYVDKAIDTGIPIFRVIEYPAGVNLALFDIFTGGTTPFEVYEDPSNNAVVVITNAELTGKRVTKVNFPNDMISGFSGAGSQNQDDWRGTRQPHTAGRYNSLTPSGATNGRSASGMSRETGESTYYNTMGVDLASKLVTAKTVQAAVSVTLEQIQDMKKQYGLDIVSLAESMLVDKLTQHINKEIVAHLFQLGWSGHVQAMRAEGIDLNLHIGTNGRYSTYLGKDDVAITFPGNGVGPANALGGLTFENTSTIQRKLMTTVQRAGDVIHQRGRRGPGTFTVSNVRLTSALKDVSGYQFAPMQNTMNQNVGAMYPAGTIAGLNIYADPNMTWTDSRVLVGRKGSDIDPGAKFMPYLIAEKVETIAELTMSPKLAVKSRYAVVDAGVAPETQYITFDATSDDVGPTF